MKNFNLRKILFFVIPGMLILLVFFFVIYPPLRKDFLEKKKIASEKRKTEYEEDVKMFVELWYQFDGSNFEANEKKGLNLIGNHRGDLEDAHQYIDINHLKQEHGRFEVVINDIQIDMTTRPVTGTIEFTQKSIWNNGYKRDRKKLASYTLHDVDRSPDNRYGVVIKEWGEKKEERYYPKYSFGLW